VVKCEKKLQCNHLNNPQVRRGFPGNHFPLTVNPINRLWR